MIVLSDLEIGPEGPCYLCVAISTTFPEPPPVFAVPVPWHPLGTASTGLRKRSAAITDWIRAMPPAAIVHAEGYVKNTLLQVIYAKIAHFRDAAK
jgi:mRNA-degrading endonuclease toxin of MazEF toxin-antitoxin module